MSHFNVWLLLALMPFPARAADTPDDPKAAVGNWTVVRLHLLGVPQDKGDLSGEFRIGDGKIRMGDADFIVEMRPSKNPLKQPSEIDFFKDAKKSEVFLRGIYKLDGDDLFICVAPTNAPRPSELKTTKENQGIMFTLKRVKPATADDKPDVTKLIAGKWEATTIKVADKDAEAASDLTWTFEGGEMVSRQAGKVTARWTYTIDASAIPIQIDFSKVENGKTTPLTIGVMKLDGDNLSVAMIPALPGPDGRPLPRPKAVEASKSNPAILTVLKRAK